VEAQIIRRNFVRKHGTDKRTGTGFIVPIAEVVYIIQNIARRLGADRETGAAILTENF
jgi:hypothetical protein